MSSPPKIINDLPLELLNQMLSYLPHGDLVKATSTCRRFREGANFRPRTLQQPVFSVEIGPRVLKAEYLAYPLRADQPKKYTIPLSHKLDAKFIRDPFAVKFFPGLDCAGINPTNIVRLLTVFLQNCKVNTLILHLRVDDDDLELLDRIPEMFHNNRAQALRWTSDHSYNTPHRGTICNVLHCAKEVDYFANFDIDERVFNVLCGKEKARFVSVEVADWFGDFHLQPATHIKVFHFRGNHQVTVVGISDFLVNWLRTFYDPAPEIDQMKEHKDHRKMGDVRNGVWISEMAFDCDVTELKRKMSQLAEPDIVLSEERVQGVEFPHDRHHLALLGERNFVRLFYDVPYFHRGVRILFYSIRPSQR